MPCGSFRLVFDENEETLYLAADEKSAAKSGGSVEVSCSELFGFGSGDFAEGTEAQDIMSDAAGRWINYQLTNDAELCIVEPDKRLPDHIKKLDTLSKASCHPFMAFH